MADGTRLDFYRVIWLELRFKGLCLEEVFVVGRVSEHDISGMPFLSDHQCMMAFGNPVISIEGKNFKSTDQHGRHLTNDV